MTRDMPAIEALAVSIGAVATAAIIGGSFGPQQPRAGAWYATLSKPRYTPPGPAIGATWGVLETLLCITGYRLLTARSSGPRTLALSGWAATLVGLAGFPAMFFGRRRLGPSTALAAGMFAAASTTALAASRVDPVEVATTAPLTAWTAFAVLLSEELWRRN